MADPHPPPHTPPQGNPPSRRRFLMLLAVAFLLAIGGYVLLAGMGGPEQQTTETAQPSQIPAPEDGDVAMGQQIAEQNCASCHAIGRTGDSPNESAPAFRTFHTQWPVEHLEEALAEGITVGHAEGMPEFQFSTEEIAHFIAYLKTLEEGA